MLLRLCRAVPVLLALAAIPGCFQSHGRDASDAAVPIDSAPRDTGLRDAMHTPPDVGPLPPDGGPRCEPWPLDFACTDRGNGAVPVGVAFDLPVGLGNGDLCFCGESIACTVEVHDRTIEIGSELCPNPSPCDECASLRVEGRCSVPPLAEGIYRVRVNGADSFELEASDALPIVGPVDLCATVPDDRECGTFYTPVVRLAETLSFETPPSDAPWLMRATLTTSCTELPTCEVRRTANRLELQLRTLEIGCPVDCGPGTFSVETTCVVPPLEAGRYQLFVWPGSEPVDVEVGASTFGGGTFTRP